MEDTNYWKNRKLNDERRDWRNGSKDWIEEYVNSKDHPHRQLIVDSVGHQLPKDYWNVTILEIGCNTGPNIAKLRDTFPLLKDCNLYGLDISKYAIERAKKELPAVNWKVGRIMKLPYNDKSFDIVLLDAVLMYISDKEIGKAMEEIDKVCKNTLVICDWYDLSKEGVVKEDLHWGRNYIGWLMDLGFEVQSIPLTSETWPNERWAKYGYVFIGTR